MWACPTLNFQFIVFSFFWGPTICCFHLILRRNEVILLFFPSNRFDQHLHRPFIIKKYKSQDCTATSEEIRIKTLMTSDSLCNHLCPFWKRSFLRAQHENPVLLSTSSSAAEFRGTGKCSRSSAWHRPAAAAPRLRGGSTAASPGISTACSEISFSSCSAAPASLCTAALHTESEPPCPHRQSKLFL